MGLTVASTTLGEIFISLSVGFITLTFAPLFLAFTRVIADANIISCKLVAGSSRMVTIYYLQKFILALYLQNWQTLSLFWNVWHNQTGDHIKMQQLQHPPQQTKVCCESQFLHDFEP